LSGAVVLSGLSDSSEEKDNSDDSLELLYTGMDADELDEVSSCGNLSLSDVRNESGRGNESMINPSLPGLLAVLEGVSRHRARKSPLKSNGIVVRRVRKPSLVLLREMKAKVNRIALVGKHLSKPKLHKSPKTRNGEVLRIFCHTP